jgi:transcriptional regulator
MYLPPQFAAKDSSTTQATAHALIRANPLASLISVDDDGLPFVTPLPLHLLIDPSTGSGRTDCLLLGHCAKPNPHWRYLAARSTAVVTFMGPHAYMTPRVYPDLARVPTWNYLMVQCTVEAHIIETFDDKDRLLKHLIADHDPAYADQWRGLGEDYQHKMMAGIVAFELRVLSMQCKVKLNQHRPEAQAAMHALYSQGNDNERALAQWMDKLAQSGK